MSSAASKLHGKAEADTLLTSTFSNSTVDGSRQTTSRKNKSRDQTPKSCGIGVFSSTSLTGLGGALCSEIEVD